MSRGASSSTPPSGAANPDAVEVCARLDGRVVWLPTVSSASHQVAAGSPQLAVHRELQFRPVPVLDGKSPAPGLDEVLDVVAAHDLVLASGHIPVADALRIFRAAHARGARRFLVNHPTVDFMHWTDDLLGPLRLLGPPRGRVRRRPRLRPRREPYRRAG
ncbi:DUF6282 family protein [Pseudonocardia lutea]|uniref:DUF6282 family protein n=1 Tax=Pseudonocardia lutea TaxID=2172015 RepID=A0ABW1IFW0_9PSEU